MVLKIPIMLMKMVMSLGAQKFNHTSNRKSTYTCKDRIIKRRVNKKV